MSARIYRLAWFLISSFVVLMLYLGYFVAVKAPELEAHPLNPRGALWEKKVLRGGILDRNGEILAETRLGHRTYPLGAAAAHVVGYISQNHGRAGIEAAANAWLAGRVGQEGIWNQLRTLLSRAGRGYDVVLTLDAFLQEKAAGLLRGRRGAIVVMEVESGAVLAMVSTPSFSPNQVDQDWGALEANPEAPLLNRALSGLYPPGSVAKLFFGAVALSQNPSLADQPIYCPGYAIQNGRRLSCPRAHGRITLKEAIEHSCNVAFATLANQIGFQKFKQAAPIYGFNRAPDFEFPVAPSRFPEEASTAEVSELAIGQGRLLMTPFHVTLLTAAIARRGRSVEPYIVWGVRNEQGRVIRLPRDRQESQLFPERVANFLAEAMVAAVNTGTAKRAGLPGIAVAGKTGTAENPHGSPHAWFTGFAPAYAPRVAVTVLVENAGSGGEAAAPLAAKLFYWALDRVERVEW